MSELAWLQLVERYRAERGLRQEDLDAIRRDESYLLARRLKATDASDRVVFMHLDAAMGRRPVGQC